jgi:hypothetical protein
MESKARNEATVETVRQMLADWNAATPAQRGQALESAAKLAGRTIHRADIGGRPACGGTGAVSSTGLANFVTCEACNAPALSREAALQQIAEAAAKFRAGR